MNINMAFEKVEFKIIYNIHLKLFEYNFHLIPVLYKLYLFLFYNLILYSINKNIIKKSETN